jgi:uncharacterized protein YjdB
MTRVVLLVLALSACVCALGTSMSCTQSVQPLLEVMPPATTLVTGETLQLAVTRRFPGGPLDVVTDHVTYSSSSRNVATVSEKGLVTAGAEAGSVVIRVVDPLSEAVATASFVVTSPRIESIEVTPAPAIVLRPGATRRFSATARLNNGVSQDVTSQVTWTSSNEAAASVGNTPADFGVVTALGEGDTTISATHSTSVQGRSIVFVRGEAAKLAAVVVTPNPATFGVGKTQQFAALGVYSDGSTKDLTSSVTWSSARGAIASIDAKGLALGIATGDTTITATGRADVGDAGAPDSGAAAGTGGGEVKGSAAASVQ